MLQQISAAAAESAFKCAFKCDEAGGCIRGSRIQTSDGSYCSIQLLKISTHGSTVLLYVILPASGSGTTQVLQQN
jgi:hypothetical protein